MSTVFAGFNANKRPVHITPEDRAKTHMHVVGASGTGKSKFLEWLIRGDVKNRNGLCLIDPHGTLYDAILQWCAYHHFTDREIILLNPSGGGYVNGFNPFTKTEAELSVQVDNQMATILRAWGAENTDKTPSLERWLRCVLEAIIENNQTLIAAEYLIDYEEKDVRDYLASKVSRPIIRRELQRLSEAKTPKQFDNDYQVLSTRNRLYRILTADQVLRFMGISEPTIDIGEIMDEGKILLVNLRPSRYLSKANSKLFGALLVQQFFQYTIQRQPGDRAPFPLYIDEFQRFVTTPDLADMLDEVRKYGLHLVMAHQRLGQLERAQQDVADALYTNANIRAVFGGLRRKSAEHMVEEMFVNQLDLKQIKKAVWATKFWPKYGRDIVRTRSHGYSSGTSSAESISSGETTHLTEAEGWFGAPSPTGTSVVRGSVSGSADMQSETVMEAEADIPIFTPIPFQELSNMEYWKKDDLVWKMSEQLMNQFTRHCFIQLPEEQTQPMLVPNVKEFGIPEKTIKQYKNMLLEREGALSVSHVDKELDKQRRALELKAQQHKGVEPSGYRHPKKDNSPPDKS